MVNHGTAFERPGVNPDFIRAMRRQRHSSGANDPNWRSQSGGSLTPRGLLRSILAGAFQPLPKRTRACLVALPDNCVLTEDKLKAFDKDFLTSGICERALSGSYSCL